MNINPEAALLKQTENITSELEILTCIILLPEFSRPKDYDRIGMSESETCDIMENLRKYQKDEKDEIVEVNGVTWTLSCANDFELFFQEQYNQILRLSRAANHVAGMVCLCNSPAQSKTLKPGFLPVFANLRLIEIVQVRDSVSLKDRHATLIASREAVIQGVEVTDQCRSIMLFSISRLFS